ncbi:Disease resistance protein RUN1 [Linum perenne]
MREPRRRLTPKGYADSPRCLDELVKILECTKTQILECTKTLGQLVLPIFYRLEPRDVRHQTEAGKLRGLHITEGTPVSAVIGNIINLLLTKLNKSLADMVIPSPPPCFDSTTVLDIKHDVFVSFRGPDTRFNFTSFLYAALARQKLRAFCADTESHAPSDFDPRYLKAVEESRSSVIVLSPGYADSSYCLDELVKILDCRKTLGQLVYVVFYHVNPTDIRNNPGFFGEAFAQRLKLSDDPQRVRKWKDALVEVSQLAGWVTSDMMSESFLIHEVVTQLSKQLRRTELVGIGSRIEQVMSLLRLDSSDVRTIALLGMGGIGKTTLANAVFNRIRHTFTASCFIEDFSQYSEHSGFSALGRQLLSQVSNDKSSKDETIDCIAVKLRRTKVLLVLDDVVSVRQLENMFGRYDCFGSGSRIIITTRNDDVLSSVGVDCTYKVEQMNESESLQLLSQLAFRGATPDKEYQDLSERVIRCVSRLPLILKVVGSSLYGRSKEAFESICHKAGPYSENTLQNCFDELDDDEKDIFLDIACFFRGQNVDFVIEFLNGCGFATEIGIAVLEEKGFLTISDDRIMVHDILRDMGRKIVQQQSNGLSKRSRLWDHKDIYEVLTTNTGTGTIEGIYLDFSRSEDMELSSEAILKMYNLRILKFFNRDGGEISKVKLPKGLDDFPDELRFLCWHGFPLKTLPSEFHPINLIELDMSYSRLEWLWEGTKCFPSLKRINLGHSPSLMQMPDLSEAPEMERIVLEGCQSLAEIDSSIQHLKKLIVLNLRGCVKIKKLPYLADLEYLEILNLAGCSNLEILPNFPRNLKPNLDGTPMEELVLRGFQIPE